MHSFSKSWRPTRPEWASSSLQNRAEELGSSLRLLDPELVAARSGTRYLMPGPGRGEFDIPLWGNVVRLTWPNLTGYSNTDDELPPLIRVLLLYYLISSDGSPMTGEWASFAALRGGRTYNAAFQGYSGDEVARHFGPEISGFRSACERCGGREADAADASFVFQALPRLSLLVTYWLGDEDLPSSCQMLFDASATNYLPIDGCAILGSMLARRLIAVPGD